MRYEDSKVSVDDTGITIRHYGPFGRSRLIRYTEVTGVTETGLGSVGRWRIIGAGPGGGSRNWYGWDRQRPAKASAFALDVGGFWRPTITPDDPEAFRAVLADRLGAR